MKDLKSVLIIYNPNAMKGKIDKFIPHIKERLLLRFSIVDCLFSDNIDGAFTLSQKYANKYDIVVACGGDGTVHQVVNGVKKSGANCVVGILPFGTCNDVARSLKIPFNLDKAIDCILRLNVVNYDIMFDGEEYITYSLATGYLTKSTYSTTNSAKRRLGRFAYFLSAFKSLFKVSTLPITIKCDGERIHGKFVYFMILSGEYAGGFRLNADDSITDGNVKLVLIKKRKGLASLLAFFRLFMFGIKSVRKNRTAIVREAKIIEIENHANAPFTIDGEKAKFLKKQITTNVNIPIIRK